MYLQSSADPDCDYMLHWFGIEWAATISSPFKGKYCAWWGPSIRKIIRFWPDCYLEIFHHKCMEDDQLVKYGEPMISSTYQLFQFVNHLWIHNFIAIIILILIQVYFLKIFLLLFSKHFIVTYKMHDTMSFKPVRIISIINNLSII